MFNFNEFGLLPEGDFVLTISQLKDSILVHGEDDNQDEWDQIRRKYLVDNLEILVKELWKVGIEKIFIDGSFVENKSSPGDIDGYFECDVMEYVTDRLKHNLNLLNEHNIWTWSKEDKILDVKTGKSKLPMWHFYNVELFPYFNGAYPFPEFFRKTRSGRSKGIIELVQ